MKDHLHRTLKTAAVVILAGVVFALCSCVSRYKPPMSRTTTTTPAGRFGVGSTSVTEAPYESPAYREAGVALFSRP